MTGKSKPPMPTKKKELNNDDPVIQADIESFPASDPPGWIKVRIGSPVPIQPDETPIKRAKRKRPKLP